MHPLWYYFRSLVGGKIISPLLSYAQTQAHWSLTDIPFPWYLNNIHSLRQCPLNPEEIALPEDAAVYATAIKAFAQSWRTFFVSGIRHLCIYIFPAAFSNEFLSLVMKKEQRALVLIAHYCALLGHFEDVWWYGPERSRRDLESLVGLIDPAWHPWLEFPLSKLRPDPQMAAFFGTSVISPWPALGTPLGMPTCPISYEMMMNYAF